MQEMSVNSMVVSSTDKFWIQILQEQKLGEKTIVAAYWEKGQNLGTDLHACWQVGVRGYQLISMPARFFLQPSFSLLAIKIGSM